jgi:DNA-binding NarL/FixJ family response regulator
MRKSQSDLLAVKVLVADSSPIHSQLLGEALGKDRRIKVVCTAANSIDIVHGVRQHRPDVLLISVSLDEQPEGGLEVLVQLRSSGWTTKAVVLLDSSKPEKIVQAFRAGARGVFSRNDPVKTLLKCICVVHAGQVWANSEQLGFALDALASAPATGAVDFRDLSLLSEREQDVVRSLSEGLTNREIAAHLNLSQHTVKNYIFRIFDKLGVSSRVELLFYVLSRSPAGSNSYYPNPEPSNAGAAAELGHDRQRSTSEHPRLISAKPSENRSRKGECETVLDRPTVIAGLGSA